MIHGRRPAGTGLTYRTSRSVLLPSNLEVLGVKAGPFARLQMIVEAHGPIQIHAVRGFTVLRHKATKSA
jgi:hypothetical protein